MGLAEARKAEREAYELEKSKSKRYGEFKDVSDAYLNVGKMYEKAGDLRKAIDNVKDAVKFALKNDKSGIEEKLDQLKLKREKVLSSLERSKLRFQKTSPMTFATLSIISLLAALFFIILNLTGHTISGLTQNNFRWFGMILFILGLVFAFFYVKNKK